MQAVATGYGLIEGPVWDAAKGLYFSDVLNGGVSLLDRHDKVSIAIEKRRGIGGMALHVAGGLVVGGRDIAFISLKDDRTKVLLTKDVTPDAIGFNDLTTDKAGRVYVGSLAYRVFGGETPKPGHLHVIDLDGSVRTISDGIMLTNGLGVSPDGKRLYHSDARGGLVRVYDVKPDGSVGPWRQFASLGEASVAEIAAFLAAWRESRFDLLRAACQALAQLLQAAWYDDAGSWRRVGYPGPPSLQAGRAS